MYTTEVVKLDQKPISCEIVSKAHMAHHKVHPKANVTFGIYIYIYTYIIVYLSTIIAIYASEEHARTCRT